MKQTDGKLISSKSIYLIKVRGVLDNRWSQWFSGMTIRSKGDITILMGVVEDQPMLRGILSKIWDLNLQVISVLKIGTQPNPEHAHQGGEQWVNS